MRIVLDASDFAEKGGRFIGVLVGESFKAARAQASESYDRFQVNTYWKQRTRGVARSFRVRRTGSMSVELRSDNKIAHFLNVGTRAHNIRPRNAPALVFYWAKVGRVVAFSKVRHPGTKKLAFDQKEAFRSLPEMLLKVDAAAEKSIERAGLG